MIGLDGDIVTIEDDTVYNIVRNEMELRNLTRAWVGLTRNPWMWQQLGQFAAMSSFECVALQ